MKKISCVIPLELYKIMKTYSKRTGIPITRIVTDSLKIYLKSKQANVE